MIPALEGLRSFSATVHGGVLPKAGDSHNSVSCGEHRDALTPIHSYTHTISTRDLCGPDIAQCHHDD